MLLASARLGARAERLCVVGGGLAPDVRKAGLHAAGDLALEGLGSPGERGRQLALPAPPALQRRLERCQRADQSGLLGVKALPGPLGALDHRAQPAPLLAPRAGEIPQPEVTEALGVSLVPGGLAGERRLEAPTFIAQVRDLGARVWRARLEGDGERAGGRGQLGSRPTRERGGG